MENINSIKVSFLTAIGLVGGYIATMLGGWDTALQTLVIFMAIDYITGLILAGVFKKSTKSENGALKSIVGWKGICKKGMTLLIVLIAVRLDMMIGTDFIRDAVIIAYVLNEVISIVENAGLMGLPVPNALAKGIDLLREKGEK